MSGSKSYDVQSPTEPVEVPRSDTTSTPQLYEVSRPPSRLSSMSSVSSQADIQDDSKQTALPIVKESIRKWSANTFDFNLEYIKSVRGILNILTVFFSLLAFSILAAACQMEAADSYTGFYCKSSDTFLFVVACSSFITITLIVACCLLSMNSDDKLRGSSYEVTIYFTYCAFFLTSSLILMSNVSIRNQGKVEYEYRYGHVVASSILGLMCCVTYGINSIWFLICNRLNRNSNYSA